MTVYEKNLQALGKAYTDMDVLIRDARTELKEETELFEEKSVDGETILRVKKDGRICYLNGRRNTREPAKMWVKNQRTLVWILQVGWKSIFLCSVSRDLRAWI